MVPVWLALGATWLVRGARTVRIWLARDVRAVLVWLAHGARAVLVWLARGACTVLVWLARGCAPGSSAVRVWLICDSHTKLQEFEPPIL